MYFPRPDTVSLVQARLEECLGPQRYKTWFKSSTQMTMTDGLLKVSAATPFICEWIERNYADRIAEVAGEITGAEVHIAFAVEPKLLHALRKRQLNSQADFINKNPDRVARETRRAGAEAAPPRKLRGRFDELVVGPANQLAVAAVRSVVGGGPGSVGSPIFVHGASGLGKTHLLQALANELSEKHPECRWAWVTGDDFTNAFVLAVRSGSIEAFRQRFRNLDVLIIDDVHCLANKKATQEEFLHTFNTIEGHRKQIVLASDTHPRLIGQLCEHLSNRFIAGMVVRIDPPDYETRCEILRRRARAVGLGPVPAEVVAYIAANFTADVRELEGALLKLLMYSRLITKPLTLSVATEALADHLHNTQRVLGVDEIDQTVATYFGLSPADLHTSRKTRTIALARGVAMYLARKHTDMSYPEIGRFMGDKNHSTVILANRRIAKQLAEDAVVARQTPAGLQEERLQEIVSKIEKQLSAAGLRQPVGGSVPLAKIGPRLQPAAPAAAGEAPELLALA